MHITFQREDLIKPLGHVAGVVERRQTLPILSNVLIRAEGGAVSLTGTDLEVEVSVRTAAEIGQEGAVTVPGRKFLDICRALPAQAQIELRHDKDRVTVRSGKSRFTLSTLPVADFPHIEAVAWEALGDIPQREFKALLTKTHFCMAQQDVRYYLNGLLLETGDGQLRAVATDGHRLARSELKVALAGAARQVIVPRKGVAELMKFLDDSDVPVALAITANHLRAVLGGLSFVTKLIDGRFPDYNKVIPSSQASQMVAERQALRETLLRAAILSNEKYRGVRLTLETDRLRVSAHNPEQEEAEEEMAVSYRGNSLEIGFNVNYLTDAIGVLASSDVEIGLNDANSSCIVREPGNTSDLYVVMPMRL